MNSYANWSNQPDFGCITVLELHCVRPERKNRRRECRWEPNDGVGNRSTQQFVNLVVFPKREKQFKGNAAAGSERDGAVIVVPAM